MSSGGHKCYPRGLLSPNVLIKYLIFIFVKANVKSSVWATCTVKKLGMWVVVDSSIIHEFCNCQCAYLVPHLHIFVLIG